MANTFTKNFMVDGSRNTIVNIHGDADGTGEESNRVIIDMSALNQPSKRMKVIKLAWGGGTGTRMRLRFGASGGQHETFFETPDQTAGEMDWTVAGGLHNNNVPNPTGDILLTTVGFNDAADYLYLIIWLKKVRKTAGG